MQPFDMWHALTTFQVLAWCPTDNENHIEEGYRDTKCNKTTDKPNHREQERIRIAFFVVKEKKLRMFPQ